MTTYPTVDHVVGTYHQWMTSKGVEHDYVLLHESTTCPDLAGQVLVEDLSNVVAATWPCEACTTLPSRRVATVDPRDEPAPERRPEGGEGGPTGSRPAQPATDAQRRYLARLAAERGVDVDPSWTRSKKDAHRAIDRLLATPVARPAEQAAAPSVRPNRYDAPCRRCGVTVTASQGALSKDAAGRWVVDHVGECPARQAATEAPETGYEPERGEVHVVDGEYFRVSVGQNSGRLYCTRWTGAEWEFAPRMVARLTADTVCTAEQASAFGAAYSRCVFCTRDLDTPESITVGYGPVCAAKRGLPWG